MPITKPYASSSLPSRALNARTSVFRKLALWARRRRSRAALGVLDAHLLRDIGLNAQSARLEAERPFWQE